MVEVTTTSIAPGGIKEGTVQNTARCAAGTEVLTVASSVDGEDWGYTFTVREPVSSFVPTAFQVMFSGDPCSTLAPAPGSGDAMERRPTEVPQTPGWPGCGEVTLTSASELITMYHDA
jgi:hypothetical protein